MSVIWVVLAASASTAVSPLLMALIHPVWPYWYMAFTAQVSNASLSYSLSSSSYYQPIIYHQIFGIALLTCLRPDFPAGVHQCPFHCWSAHHLGRLSLTNAGFRRRSVQHLRTARHVNWTNGDFCHLRVCDGCLERSRQSVPKRTDGRVSCCVLGVVCMHGHSLYHGCVGTAPCREDWSEARLIQASLVAIARFAHGTRHMNARNGSSVQKLKKSMSVRS